MADHNGLVIPPPHIDLPPAAAPHAADGGETHCRMVIHERDSAVQFVWTIDAESVPSDRALRKSDEAEARD
jgi:hypothetical protein